MTAGFNLKVDVWRLSFPSDDIVGGAVVTGTVVYHNIKGRMTEEKSSPLLLEQGIETERIFNIDIRPASLIVYERDEIEIVFPLTHWHYRQRFRVIGVKHPSMHATDSRDFLTLTLRRRDRAHVQQ